MQSNRAIVPAVIYQELHAPSPAPRRLTEGFIKSLPLGTPVAVRDTKVTGLMVTVNKKSKSYKVQRDLWRGQRGHRQLIKTVRHTLGTTSELSLEEARQKAEDIIRQIKLGIDPNEPHANQRAEGWTVDILFDEYAADMRKRECSERTIIDTLARRDRYLADWKHMPLCELTRSMVRAKHEERVARQSDFKAEIELNLLVFTSIEFSRSRFYAYAELLEPIRTMLNARSARARIEIGKAVEAARNWSRSGSDVRAQVIKLQLRGYGYPLPLGWRLSPVTRHLIAFQGGLTMRCPDTAKTEGQVGFTVDAGCAKKLVYDKLR